jgi:hypothetical protein
MSSGGGDAKLFARVRGQLLLYSLSHYQMALEDLAYPPASPHGASPQEFILRTSLRLCLGLDTPLCLFNSPFSLCALIFSPSYPSRP